MDSGQLLEIDATEYRNALWFTFVESEKEGIEIKM